jgi:hypothetical protein
MIIIQHLISRLIANQTESSLSRQMQDLTNNRSNSGEKESLIQPGYLGNQMKDERGGGSERKKVSVLVW